MHERKEDSCRERDEEDYCHESDEEDGCHEEEDSCHASERAEGKRVRLQKDQFIGVEKNGHELDIPSYWPKAGQRKQHPNHLMHGSSCQPMRGISLDF